MATGLIHFFDTSRFTSTEGGATSATVTFYYSGTTNLAPIYSDIELLTPKANPVLVATGAILPTIFLDPSISYRRRTEFADGSVWDVDPIPVGDTGQAGNVAGAVDWADPYPRGGVVCIIGDSITDQASITGPDIVLYGEGGVYEGWKVWNSASNGSRLRDWYNSIASGDQNAAPMHGNDVTRNLWRLVNANPTEIVIMLGTNDIRILNGASTYANLAAFEARFADELREVVDFLLENCPRARIDLQIPFLLTYIAGSVTGFCNFTDADDAYLRNKAMRDAYRTLHNYSSRVSITDLHAAFFAPGTAETSFRWDSLALSLDPDYSPTISIKVDELHPMPYGNVRRFQIMQRRRMPEIPYKPTIQKPPAALFQGGSFWSCRAYIKGVGAGYVDFYSNTIETLFGNLSPGSTQNRSLRNKPRAEDFYMDGYQSRLFLTLQSATFTVFDSAGTAFVISPTSVVHTQVDTLIDYFRVSFAGGATPTLIAGLADLYVTIKDRLPRFPSQTDGVTLHLDGKDATPSSRVVLPLTPDGVAYNGLPALSNNTVQATRQSSPDAATFDLYFSTGTDGSFDSTNATYDKAAPGILMGTITLPINNKMQSTWAPTADCTALGGLIPPNGYPWISAYAVKTGGTIGDWANITIKTR